MGTPTCGVLTGPRRTMSGSADYCGYSLPIDSRPANTGQTEIDRKMMEGAAEPNRVKFYGPGDLAAYWQVDRIADVVARFDVTTAPGSVGDAIELHNVELHLAAGILPAAYSEAERAAALALAPQIHAAVAKFFSSLDLTNITVQLGGIPYNYRPDLLELLGRNKAYERCDAEVMLPALTAAGINFAEMLGCKKLVYTYDSEVRDLLLTDPRNAEHLIRKYLHSDVSSDINLPKSFTLTDKARLLTNYMDYADANPNFVQLIATAPTGGELGIDAKLKLKAKRLREQMNEEIFRENPGMKTGAEVSISDSQDEPVIVKLDEMVMTFTYSRGWLDQTLDNASILNNFQHLFEFADRHALLNLPSFPAELGVFERFLTTKGRRDYHVGAGFRGKDMSSLLQTHMYRNFLSSKDIDLEAVIAWFFGTYLVEEFGVLNFIYMPSNRTSSYLEKARHLFAEMEGVANQFRHYAQDGEIDRELLTITSEPVAYDEIPSLLDGKYVYATDDKEIHSVLHLLFSDQSGLTYINDALNDSDAAGLLIKNEVLYTDFHEHQLPSVNHLVSLGVLENTGTRVQIANTEQFQILHSLFAKQVAAYHRLSPAGRAQVDALSDRGWVTRRSSLLSEAEASYFNYFLNKSEFSNGPELRNKYLHGSQANSESENEHFQTYVTALRLILALIIKMNDEFCLSTTSVRL